MRNPACCSMPSQWRRRLLPMDSSTAGALQRCQTKTLASGGLTRLLCAKPGAKQNIDTCKPPLAHVPRRSQPAWGALRIKKTNSACTLIASLPGPLKPSAPCHRRSQKLPFLFILFSCSVYSTCHTTGLCSRSTPGGGHPSSIERQHLGATSERPGITRGMHLGSESSYLRESAATQWPIGCCLEYQRGRRKTHTATPIHMKQNVIDAWCILADTQT